ncbi:unnamed protein product [Camellia sinensis]
MYITTYSSAALRRASRTKFLSISSAFRSVPRWSDGVDWKSPASLISSEGSPPWTSEHAFKGILTGLHKPGGGEYGKFYSLPALNDPRIGYELFGKLRNGVTATDLVLTVTQMLRKHGVGKFVEFYGEGVGKISLADRATIANMSPEYGATMGFFPVDHVTLQYLNLTGRSEETVAMIEAYLRANNMFVDYNERLCYTIRGIEQSGKVFVPRTACRAYSWECCHCCYHELHKYIKP